MTTTRSRSLTITLQGEDVRVHLDSNGLVTVSERPIGRIVESANGWKPASVSGITGRECDLQKDAVTAVVGRWHRQAVQARDAASA